MIPESIAKAGTEFAHQCALFCWAANNVGKYPELKWLHSIQNEEKSGSKIVGARSKASGKKAGVSDVCLPVKRLDYSGVYIEMKKPGSETTAKGKPSPEQVEFGRFVFSQGFLFCICYTWEEAVSFIEQYLNLKRELSFNG